jgi:hypothetical protein
LWKEDQYMSGGSYQRQQADSNHAFTGGTRVRRAQFDDEKGIVNDDL